jgi:hypothetical protein
VQATGGGWCSRIDVQKTFEKMKEICAPHQGKHDRAIMKTHLLKVASPLALMWSFKSADQTEMDSREGTFQFKRLRGIERSEA